MERRKFLIGMGTAAAGSAATIGSGAFNVVRADRSITVETTNDSSAYLGLVGTSAYASGSGDGELEVTIDELGEDSNYVFNDVFKIVNNGQDNIIVDLSDNREGIEWDTEYPRAYWSSEELGTSTEVGGDGEFNDERPVLSSGDEVFIQFEFVGREHEENLDPADAPDVIGVYAQGTNRNSNLGD